MSKPTYRLEGNEIRPVREREEGGSSLFMRLEGEHIVLSSVVWASAATPARRRQIALWAWQRNAATDLVSFTFDQRGRLVGMIRHPEQFLDRAELQVYISRLRYECARFKGLLTGWKRRYE